VAASRRSHQRPAGGGPRPRPSRRRTSRQTISPSLPTCGNHLPATPPSPRPLPCRTAQFPCHHGLQILSAGDDRVENDGVQKIVARWPTITLRSVKALVSPRFLVYVESQSMGPISIKCQITPDFALL